MSHPRCTVLLFLQLTAEHKGVEDREFLVWEQESRRLLWSEQSQQDAVFRDSRAQAVASGWPSCGCQFWQPEKWRHFRGLGAQVVRFRIFHQDFLLDRLWNMIKDRPGVILPWQLISRLCIISFIGWGLGWHRTCLQIPNVQPRVSHSGKTCVLNLAVGWMCLSHEFMDEQESEQFSDITSEAGSRSPPPRGVFSGHCELCFHGWT